MFWYEETPANTPSIVAALVQRLDDTYLKDLTSTWNETAQFYSQSQAKLSTDQLIPDTNTGSYNIMKIATDTVATRMLVDKPAPKVLTSGAKEEVQQRAQRQEHFILGAMQTASYNAQASLVQLDGILFGVGWIKVFAGDKKINMARVDPRNVLLDPTHLDLEGKPFSLFQRQKMHPAEVKAQYNVEVSSVNHEVDHSEFVWVYEGWRRSVGDTKGRHVICTEHENLITPEEWDYADFPLIPYRPEAPLRGWWSNSLGGRLCASQRALNFIDEIMKGGMERWNTPLLILPGGATGQQAAALSNSHLWAIIHGDKPDFIEAPIVLKELLDLRDRIKGEALESVGVGPYAASGVKPAGLSSGVAISWHYDIESQQMTKYLSENERFIVKVALAVIREAKYISEQDTDFAVKFTKDHLSSIKWKEVNLETDQYTVEVQASSALPHLFSGRVEVVKSLADSGLINDPSLIRQLLRLPDLESWQDLDNAPRDALQLLLDDVVDNGADHLPEAFDNLQLALELGLQYRARAIVDHKHQAIIDKLTDWCAEASRLMAPPMPEGPGLEAPLPPAPVEGVMGAALPPPPLGGPTIPNPEIPGALPPEAELPPPPPAAPGNPAA